jgi:hypothetical protein
MFRKFMLSLAAFLALGTSLIIMPAQARADRFHNERREHREWHERRDHHELHRIVWQYSGGFFKDAGNGRWEETNASGHYCFQEVRRTGEYVDMFDASRGFTVRLYGNAMYLQGGSSYPVFTKFYDGRWTE